MPRIGRPGTSSKLTIALSALVGLTGASGNLPKTKLEAIASDPRAFEHKTVRTCGWASNAFEDVMIRTHRHVVYDKAVGLGVEWCPRTPDFEDDYMCVTGVLQGPVVSTGSPFQWELVQQCPAK